MTVRIKVPSMLLAGALLALSFANNSIAGPAPEEARLLTATEVLEEVQAMPDQRVPDTLLAHAYGIAVIPDVTKIAFFFGGRHGNGVLTVRDTLNSPWSNPVFVSLTGGSWGLASRHAGLDIILVFTTQERSRGHRRRQVHARAPTHPWPRARSAARDRLRRTSRSAEIYSYARTRGLFGGIAVDGTAIAIDKSANRAFYGKTDVTASEIFSGQAPAPPATAQRFLARLAQATHSAVRGSPAPQADMPASAAQVAPVAGAPAHRRGAPHVSARETRVQTRALRQNRQRSRHAIAAGLNARSPTLRPRTKRRSPRSRYKQPSGMCDASLSSTRRPRPMARSHLVRGRVWLAPRHARHGQAAGAERLYRARAKSLLSIDQGAGPAAQFQFSNPPDREKLAALRAPLTAEAVMRTRLHTLHFSTLRNR